MDHPSTLFFFFSPYFSPSWLIRSEPIRKVTCRILSPLTKKPSEDKADKDAQDSGGGGVAAADSGTKIDDKPRYLRFARSCNQTQLRTIIYFLSMTINCIF